MRVARWSPQFFPITTYIGLYSKKDPMTNGSPEILDQFTYFLLQFRILGQIRPKNDQNHPKTLKNHLSPAYRCYCGYSDVPDALGWLATWFWDDLDRFCHLIATKSSNFRKFASPDANLRHFCVKFESFSMFFT